MPAELILCPVALERCVDLNRSRHEFAPRDFEAFSDCGVQFRYSGAAKALVCLVYQALGVGSFERLTGDRIEGDLAQQRSTQRSYGSAKPLVFRLQFMNLQLVLAHCRTKLPISTPCRLHAEQTLHLSNR
jgi:hypothetical protein